MSILAIALATLVLGLWVDVRWPRLRPASLRALVVHVVVADLALLACNGPLADLLQAQLGGRAAGWGYLAGATAALTYAWLIGLWLVRSAVEVAPHRR